MQAQHQILLTPSISIPVITIHTQYKLFDIHCVTKLKDKGKSN